MSEERKEQAGAPDEVVRFVKELSVARRQTSAYPPGHPMVVSALRNAARRLEAALASEAPLRLAAVRETLYAREAPLEDGNPAFRDLARTFRKLGLAGVRFEPGTTGDDLAAFLALLNSDPAEVAEGGGIEKAAAAFSLGSIHVTGIDYGRLQAAEQEVITDSPGPDPPRDLWEEFVLGLLAEDASGGGAARVEDGDGAGGPALRVRRDVLERILGRPVEGNAGTEGRGIPEGTGSGQGADAELLARVVNTAPETLAAAIAGPEKRELLRRLVRRLDRKDLSPADRSRALRNLTGFLTRLDPDKQGDFLRDLVPLLAERPQTAESVLSGLSGETLAGILMEADAGEKTPPALLGVLRKLAGESAKKAPEPTRTGHRAEPAGKGKVDEKIRQIFREEQSEEFVPDAYRGSLDLLLGEEAAEPATEETRRLGAILRGMGPVEPRVAAIIFEILKRDPPEEEAASLRKNLKELCAWFLETGDFRVLTLVHDSMAPGVSKDDRPGMPALSCFADPEALGEILNGLDFWGKEKYDEIAMLIRKVGPAFIEPMLRKLADSPSMSVRRFLLDRIAEAGAEAVPAILERLNDGRWYFVRNLILLLRKIGDASTAERIRRHLDHPHPRVRQEAVRTLLAFKDPATEDRLRNELRSPDRGVQQQAVLYAAYSHSGEVLKELLKILESSAVLDYRLEIKLAAVQALADAGHPGILPALEAVLLSSPLLHRRAHRELQREILKSLSRYPAEAALDMLESLERKARGELRRMTAEAVREIRRRTPHAEAQHGHG